MMQISFVHESRWLDSRACLPDTWFTCQLALQETHRQRRQPHKTAIQGQLSTISKWLHSTVSPALQCLALGVFTIARTNVAQTAYSPPPPCNKYVLHPAVIVWREHKGPPLLLNIQTRTYLILSAKAAALRLPHLSTFALNSSIAPSLCSSISPSLLSSSLSPSISPSLDHSPPPPPAP